MSSVAIVFFQPCVCNRHKLFDMIILRDGKFVEAGNQFWFPDDVTLGYIIGRTWPS